MALTDHAKTGFQRLLAPLADFLVRRGVSPNAVTTTGTLLTVIGGGIYGWGHIHVAGWVVGLSAICDVIDGTMARRSGKASVFGAFYDSTLDRIADAAVLGGIGVFFARNGVHHAVPVSASTPMMAVVLLAIIGSFLTSYTRARAEGLGIDAKVGILQRPERIVLLSAPQAFFGLAFGGWVLMGICILLMVTAWITVVQRIAYVYRCTNGQQAAGRVGINPREDVGTRSEPPVSTEPRLADARPDVEPAGRPGPMTTPPSLDAAR